MVSRRAGLTVTLAALMALSGCLATGVLDDQQENQVVDEFEDRIDEVDAYHATMITTTTIDGDSEEVRSEVWARPDSGEIRQEVLAPEKRAGDLTVSNGSVMWSYDESAGTATRVNVGEIRRDAGFGSYLDGLTEQYDIAYNGTETLDGQQTYRVTLLPNASASTIVDSKVTLWLDTDRMFPLKTHTEVGDDISTTVRYTDLEINPDIPVERFEFEPQKEVEIKEPGIPDVESYDSRAALADATDRDVPTPDLPEDLTFESGTVSVREGSQQVHVVYSNDTDRVSIGIVRAPDDPSTDGETVDLGDQTATYETVGDVGIVAWTCDGMQYSVSGTLEQSTLVDAAASVSC